MTKQSVVIEGYGSSAAFGGTVIANLIKMKFDTLRGERKFIDLTGLGDEVVNGYMSEVKDFKTITLTVKSDPAVIGALSDDNKQLVITFPTNVGKTFTAWAQIESDSGVDIEGQKRGETDLVFRLTNLNDTGVVTAPAFA